MDRLHIGDEIRPSERYPYDDVVVAIVCAVSYGATTCVVRALHTREQTRVWVVARVIRDVDGGVWRLHRVSDEVVVDGDAVGELPLAGAPHVRVKPARVRVTTNTPVMELLVGEKGEEGKARDKLPAKRRGRQQQQQQQRRQTDVWGGANVLCEEAEAGALPVVTDIYSNSALHGNVTAYSFASGGGVLFEGHGAGNVVDGSKLDDGIAWAAVETCAGTRVCRFRVFRSGPWRFCAAVDGTDGGGDSVVFDARVTARQCRKTGDVLYCIGAMLPREIRVAIAEEYGAVLERKANMHCWPLYAACLESAR